MSGRHSEKRTTMKNTVSSQVPSVNTGNTLKPQKATEGPSLIRKIVSPAQTSKSIGKHVNNTTSYSKFVTVHINGGSEWLTKNGFSYNSSVQPIFAFDKGVIHNIVIYPTVIVTEGLLLLYKNVEPEETPVAENIIASIKINVIAEELPHPLLISAQQLADTELSLSPGDRISMYSATDTTGVDIEVGILYV